MILKMMILMLFTLTISVDCQIILNEYNLTIFEEIQINTEVYELNTKEFAKNIYLLNNIDDDEKNVELTSLTFTFLDSTRTINSYFQINPHNYTLSIQKRIDREQICESRLIKTCTCNSPQCQLKLDILANGLIYPHLTSFYHIFTLNIYILDINDNKPKFLFTQYTIELPENVKHNNAQQQSQSQQAKTPQQQHQQQRIPLPIAYDSDYGQNTIQKYILTDKIPVTTTTTSSDEVLRLLNETIDSDSGLNEFQVDDLNLKNIYLKVLNNQNLDFERKSDYELYLYAIDGGQPHALYDYTKLVIKIIDQNDNNPVFEVLNFKLNLSELTPVNTKLLQVKAFDADSMLNNNSLIEYTFATNSNDEHRSGSGGSGADVMLKYFHLNKQNGELYLIQSLDYERHKTYKLIITAYDKGTPNLYAVQPCVVDINVYDENDNSPEINIITIYDQIQQQYDKLFAQTTTTATPPSSIKGPSTTTIHINEAAFINSFICLITINDLDSQFNAYFLIQPNDSRLKIIELKNGSSILLNGGSAVNHGGTGSSNGGSNPNANTRIYALIINQKLNRELSKSYNIHVKAVDTGQLETVLNINLIVLDSNDNKPICYGHQNERIEFLVNENNQFNQLIGCLNCTDSDELDNARLDYYIVSQNSLNTEGYIINNEDGIFLTDDVIRINKATGCLYALKSFDREKQARYKLNISISDNGLPKQTTHVDVHIHVNDLNDNVPYFTKSLYNFTIYENTPPNTHIGKVYAYDSDLNENSRLEFTMVSLDTSAGPFRINSQTGSIYIDPSESTDIDDDTETAASDPSSQTQPTSEFRYMVHVNDNGQPSFGTSCLVHINIIDVNDNCPQFKIEQSNYIENIIEDVNKNDLISALFYINLNQLFAKNKLHDQLQIAKLNIYDLDRDYDGNSRVTILNRELSYFKLPSSPTSKAVIKSLKSKEEPLTSDTSSNEHSILSLSSSGHVYLKSKQISRFGLYKLKFDLKDNPRLVFNTTSSTSCTTKSRLLLVIVDNSTQHVNNQLIRIGIDLLIDESSSVIRKNSNANGNGDVTSRSSLLFNKLLRNNKKSLVLYISISLICVIIALIILLCIYFVIFKGKLIMLSSSYNGGVGSGGGGAGVMAKLMNRNKRTKQQQRHDEYGDDDNDSLTRQLQQQQQQQSSSSTPPTTISYTQNSNKMKKSIQSGASDTATILTQNYKQLTNLINPNDYLLKPQQQLLETSCSSSTSSSSTPITSSTMTSLANQRNHHHQQQQQRSVLV